jgi:hypothetical protein
MAIKIYKTGNYIVFDNGVDTPIENLAENTKVTSIETTTGLKYQFIDTLNSSKICEYLLSDITDENGDAYSDFETWKDSNTGTSGGSGGSSGGLTNAELRATPVPVSGPLTDIQLRATPINTYSNGVNYLFSTINSTSAQLTAGTSFVGTIESVLLYPSISFLAFADQNLTITIDQFIDALGAKISESRTLSYSANEKLGISFPINGNYVRVTVKNESASSTTTLQVDTAYGEIESTNLSQDDYLRGEAARTTTVNNILTPVAGSTPIDVTKFRSFTCQVVSTGTAGTYIFEGSNDGTNFQAIPVFNQALVVRVPIITAITATSSQIIYEGSCNFKFIRLRIATTISGGSIQAHTLLSHESFANTLTLVSNGTAANLLATVSGTVTANIGTGSLAAGTNLYGDVGLQARANATGAGSVAALNSPATPAAQSIKGTAGRILGIYVNNANAAVRFLKIFNIASVTLGTTSAVFEVPIPPSNNAQWIDIPVGIGASTAIVVAITGARGLTDNTTITTANEVTGFVVYA